MHRSKPTSVLEKLEESPLQSLHHLNQIWLLSCSAKWLLIWQFSHLIHCFWRRDISHSCRIVALRDWSWRPLLYSISFGMRFDDGNVAWNPVNTTDTCWLSLVMVGDKKYCLQAKKRELLQHKIIIKEFWLNPKTAMEDEFPPGSAGSFFLINGRLFSPLHASSVWGIAVKSMTVQVTVYCRYMFVQKERMLRVNYST